MHKTDTNVQMSRTAGFVRGKNSWILNDVDTDYTLCLSSEKLFEAWLYIFLWKLQRW